MTEQQLARMAKRRLAILRHAEEITGNVSLTCRYYGISRQCFYTWKRRYDTDGLDGLRDRSHRPQVSPNATRTEVVGKIIYLRQHYHFGPAKIAMYLKRYHEVQISNSGVWRILKRLELNRLPASQRYKRHDRRWKRYEKPLPGHRVQIDVKWFPERPPRPGPRDLWNSIELAYDADFRAGDTTLSLRRHDGGTVDWMSFDASAPLPEPANLPAPVSVVATRVQYPGAPHPRWWQIEEARTDLGAYAPDRSHFASLLLLELVTSHSDDWFTFPVAAQLGHVLTLHEATVVDSLGGRWNLELPGDGWTLFAVTGLDPRAMLLWPTVATALTGPVLDQVDFGVDEDANIVWAVERRVAGTDLPTPERPQLPPAEPADPTQRLRYAYRPSTEVPPFWHPYLIGEDPLKLRRLIQGRLADLSGRNAVLMPHPATDLLRPSSADTEQPRIHRIEPAAIPVDGLQLERRYMLARRTDGQPVLWRQRRRVALAAPPTMRQQHDVLELE